MALNTLVIYFKNPKIKKWLQLKAKKLSSAKKKQSVSSLVSEIIENEFEKETKKNPFVEFAEIGKTFSEKEMEEHLKIMDEVRKSRKSRPDSYYKNLFS